MLAALAAVLGGTVDAARGGVDETRDTGRLARPRQHDRAEMVDFIGRTFVQLTERVVRQFGKVDDCVGTLRDP